MNNSIGLYFVWSLLIIVLGSAFRISGTPNRKPGVAAVKSVYMLRAASEAEAERYGLKLLLCG